MRHREFFVLLCAVALASVGCGNRRIVRASPPPSVRAAPVEEKPPAPEPEPPPVTAATPETLPVAPIPPPAGPPAPARRPAPRPRPTQAENSGPTPAPPKPAPPQISPQLSARDLAAAQRNTTANITTAEKNVQATTGKQLNVAQNDLVEKIRGFLAQAHEAILAEDWVRAENLADKARVLSIELTKSL